MTTRYYGQHQSQSREVIGTYRVVDGERYENLQRRGWVPYPELRLQLMEGDLDVEPMTAAAAMRRLRELGVKPDRDDVTG